jgi:hypothetical protein
MAGTCELELARTRNPAVAVPSDQVPSGCLLAICSEKRDPNGISPKYTSTWMNFPLKDTDHHQEA